MLSLLQSITGFTVFHGLVLFIVLSLHRTNAQSQNDFKFIILIFTIYIGEFLLVVTGLIRYAPHLVLVTYPLIFCIGPLFVFFAQKITHTFQKKTYWLLAIPLLFYLLLIPFYGAPASYKLSILNDFSKMQPDYPVIYFFASTPLTFNLYTIVLLLFSARFIKQKVPASKKASRISVFLFLLALGLSFFVLLYFINQIFPNQWLGLLVFLQPFLFALSLYFIGYWLIFTPEITRHFIKSDQNSYIKSPLSKEYKGKYVQRLQQLLTEQKPYLISGFSSEALAKELGISKHELSQVLSQELQTSFSELINKLRIEEACLRLVSQNRPIVQNIALEVGYNNKVSFYRAFKKFTQKTPSEYLEEYKKNNL